MSTHDALMGSWFGTVRRWALVLLLAVHLDEVVSETLEQSDRHGRVVDECAVSAGARELSTDQQLAVLQGDTGFLQDRPRWRAGGDGEARLDGRSVGIAPNDIGLRACAAYQQEGVDQDGLAGAGLAGEHVEPRSKLDGRAFDDGEVLDAQLSQHLEEARTANDEAQGVSKTLPRSATAPPI